jgi:phosphoribosylanthranilate isomerase
VARVKICGLTSVADAEACVRLGADAIGLNFVPTSPRRVDEAKAREIVAAVGGSALVVAVVASLPLERMRALKEATGVGCLQLHGDESADDVRGLLPHAYKAIRVGSAEDVARAESMPGDYVMVDARVEGALGGTGRTFDWELVVNLAQRRKLVLAGGLTPENVGAAIARVRPWCVDVASGVEREGAPGVKDLARVRAFIDAARSAAG